MSRFGSGGDGAASPESFPLTVSLFDCLHLDGDDLLDRPCQERFALLATRVPEHLRVSRIETDDPATASASSRTRWHTATRASW